MKHFWDGFEKNAAINAKRYAEAFEKRVASHPHTDGTALIGKAHRRLKDAFESGAKKSKLSRMNKNLYTREKALQGRK